MNTGDKFNLFIEKTRQLMDSRLAQKKLSPSLSIKYDIAQGTRFEIWEPDEQDLWAFLLPFRQFVAKGEPIYIEHIYNLADGSITSDYLRGQLRKSRGAWKDASKGKGFRLVVDGEQLTPADVLDLWLNGVYFHSDPQKREKLRRLMPVGQLFARHFFLDLVAQATAIIVFVSRVLTAALYDRQVSTGQERT